MATAYLLDNAIFVAETKEQLRMGLERLLGMIHCYTIPASEHSIALYRHRSQADAFGLANEDCDLVCQFTPGDHIEGLIPSRVTETVSLHLWHPIDGSLCRPRVTLSQRNASGDGFSKIDEAPLAKMWNVFGPQLGVSVPYPIHEITVPTRDGGTETLPLHTSSAPGLLQRARRLPLTTAPKTFDERMVATLLPVLEDICALQRA